MNLITKVILKFDLFEPIKIFMNHLLLCFAQTKVWEKNKQDTIKNWLFVKNQQFLSNPDKNCWKWLAHEAIIFTKFYENWTKIVNFLLMPKFWKRLVFLLRPYQTTSSWCIVFKIPIIYYFSLPGASVFCWLVKWQQP